MLKSLLFYTMLFTLFLQASCSPSSPSTPPLSTSPPAPKWEKVAELLMYDPPGSDNLRATCTMNESILVVGIPWEENGQLGIDTANYAAGVVVIFEKEEDTWVEKQQINAADRQPFDYFGASLAIDQHTLAIGAPGVNLPSDNNLPFSSTGAVYIYQENLATGEWEQQQKLMASDGKKFSYFGQSISLQGNYLLVGDPAKAYIDEGNDTISSSGGAYLFKRNSSGRWEEIQRIAPGHFLSSMRFGVQVVLNEPYAVVSTNPFLDTIRYQLAQLNSGVFCYRLSSSEDSLQLIQELGPPLDNYNVQYGKAIGVSGDRLIIGAPGAYLYNKFDFDPSLYIYQLTNEKWELSQQIDLGQVSGGRKLSNILSVQGDRVIVSDHEGTSYYPPQMVDMNRATNANDFSPVGSVNPDQERIHDITHFNNTFVKITVEYLSENDSIPRYLIHIYEELD